MTEDDSIDFRSTGGTKGKEYDNVLNHENLTYLFCVNKDFKMWLIPTSELTTKSIKLRTEPNSNGIGFQSYLYQVSI